MQQHETNQYQKNEKTGSVSSVPDKGQENESLVISK